MTMETKNKSDNKKYKLSNETIEVNGHILHRIIAIKDFGEVKKGDKGGFIESEDNLSHYDLCWVANDAKVHGHAWVSGNAIVEDYADVYNYAKVFDHAIVKDYAKVYGNTWVCDNAVVSNHARVCGHARVFDHAIVKDYAWVFDHAIVKDYAKVCNNAEVCDYAEVYDYSKVCGKTYIYGYAQISGDAVIKKMGDYIIFLNTWSSGRWFTWTKSNNKWKVGCFYGSGQELIEKAYADDKNKGDNYKTYVELVENLMKNDNESKKV